MFQIQDLMILHGAFTLHNAAWPAKCFQCASILFQSVLSLRCFRGCWLCKIGKEVNGRLTSCWLSQLCPLWYAVLHCASHSSTELATQEESKWNIEAEEKRPPTGSTFLGEQNVNKTSCEPYCFLPRSMPHLTMTQAVRYLQRMSELFYCHTSVRQCSAVSQNWTVITRTNSWASTLRFNPAHSTAKRELFTQDTACLIFFCFYFVDLKCFPVQCSPPTPCSSLWQWRWKSILLFPRFHNLEFLQFSTLANGSKTQSLGQKSRLNWSFTSKAVI